MCAGNSGCDNANEMKAALGGFGTGGEGREWKSTDKAAASKWIVVEQREKFRWLTSELQLSNVTSWFEQVVPSRVAARISAVHSDGDRPSDCVAFRCNLPFTIEDPAIRERPH